MFHSNVWESGYQLADTRVSNDGPPVRVITMCHPEHTWLTSITVPIPAEAYLAFATQCTTEAAVVAFANQYGLLGIGQDVDCLTTDDGVEAFGEVAEPITAWLDAAANLRWHWQYWQDLGTAGVNSEDRTLGLLEHGAMVLLPPPGVPSVWGMERASRQTPPPDDTPADLLDDHDVYAAHSQGRALWEAIVAHDEAETARVEARAARQALTSRAREARRIGEGGPSWSQRTQAQTRDREAQIATKAAAHRRRRCARRLGWTLLGLRVTSWLRSLGVVPALTAVSLRPLARSRTIAGVPMGLRFLGPTLLAAFWLQLALAITKKVRYRPCLGCGTFLTIHPDGYRTNRRTCSDSCRQKVSRRKRQGKPPRRRRAP